MPTTILLIGTLDTKGAEFAFARDLIRARGHRGAGNGCGGGGRANL